MKIGLDRYFVVNKPYNMVSQFVSSHKVRLLGDLDFNFPEGTHAVGRLDINSEGLLILTTNKKVTRLLFESEKPHERTYLVQVKKTVTEETLQKLRTGVSIRVKGGGDYITHPCKAEIASNPEAFVEIKKDAVKYQPDTWLLITLTEGKFRQVRKMVAAANHQCKRLVRISIENLALDDLLPGAVREIDENTFFERLKIDKF
jgi:23S rRNA pseudouridine2457 synthase